jgi:hypothetical protein
MGRNPMAFLNKKIKYTIKYEIDNTSPILEFIFLEI